MSRNTDKPSPPFIMHYAAMRESKAWRHLPDNARRILDVLERENARHGGLANGSLKSTYDDFTRVAGIRRQSIALAMRQCVELGFVEVTYRAMPSIAEHRRGSEYRLTYIYRRRGPEMTDDWKRIGTDAEALTALARAKGTKSASHVRKARAARKEQPAPERRRHVAYKDLDANGMFRKPRCVFAP
jgi:hypothetical protein